MPISSAAAANNNIPYSQQEALAIGYAQYALMHTLTQQFRANYPAAFLHAAAASGYLPLTSPMMAAAVAAASANSTPNGNKSSAIDKSRERRKPALESDNNNNHIRSTPSLSDQPYRRETYQTLLESSRILGQQKLLKPVPIDLRKHNGGSRTLDNSRFHSSSIKSQTFLFHLQVPFPPISVIHPPPPQHRHPILPPPSVHRNPTILNPLTITFASRKN